VTPLLSLLRRLPVLALLLGLLGAAFAPRPALAADDFLEPDQAFRLSATRGSEREVALRYEVATGYYLYRERFAFEVSGPATLGEVPLPAGQVKYDETFAKDMETYRGVLSVNVPVQATGPFRLTVTSQGCADKGLCYPPRPQVVEVGTDATGAITSVKLLPEGAEAAAPGALAGAGGTTAAADAASTGNRIDGVLRDRRLPAIVAAFVLFGLALSFTPCVLPMLPILSSIIVGQGAPVSRGRGFALSAAYSLGMALVYTLMGIAAALAGEGLAAYLQNPWVLGAFAALLGVLALSMFGFYELQLPAALQSRLTEASGRLPGGRFVGVFLMGGLSALIVGPCVAAPLAGVLVYVSQTRDVLVGATALFSLAAGMSVPLLLVGASAGTLLPRGGAWMERVKHVFGALLLGTAIWMVTPVLPDWAVMSAWGVWLLVAAVYLHAFDRLPEGSRGWARLFKGVGVVLALVGAAQLLGALSGGRDVLQPLGHLAGARGGVVGTAQAAAHGEVSFTRVRSLAELDAAVKAAGGKPVMLDFWAEWCVSCKEYEKFTFQDPRVKAKLAGAVLLQADVTANNEDDRALLKRFGLFGPPGILFFDASGRELADRRVIGYQAADEFLGSLQRAGL
jgi:thiol:disulfide interchange protein DsbD